MADVTTADKFEDRVEASLVGPLAPSPIRLAKPRTVCPGFWPGIAWAGTVFYKCIEAEWAMVYIVKLYFMLWTYVLKRLPTQHYINWDRMGGQKLKHPSPHKALLFFCFRVCMVHRRSQLAVNAVKTTSSDSISRLGFEPMKYSAQKPWWRSIFKMTATRTKGQQKT